MTYTFFTAQLRFVAKKTQRESDEIALMMDSLENIAKQIDENDKNFTVLKNNLTSTARALAGVAGFLQQHILPETVAAEHALGEAQVRWSIDTCMDIMGRLMAHAELHNEQEDMRIELPDTSF